MEQVREDVALPATEVPMVEPETVRVVRELTRRGWGIKTIARELELSRNTVRRYVRGGAAAEHRARESRSALDEQQRAEAVRLLEGPAEGNAVVVARLLRAQGATASVRTVERAVAAHRREKRAADLATVRFETAPGEQMQIDFGEKRVAVGGRLVKVLLFVAVLGYSRRIFARTFHAQRLDDWCEGLASAFRHFGGLPKRLLIDNAGAMVVGRDTATGTAKLHPGFAAFLRDVSVEARACQPRRARTKGKTERGVGYVKHNAIAGLDFVSMAALDGHLAAWCLEADERIHGSTYERPRERFERGEKQALRPLPSLALPVRERRLRRRVAADCFVDVDTVRYSVPHRLVRRDVEVLIEEEQVRIFFAGEEVARHRRSREMHVRIVEPSHLDGLWRRPGSMEVPAVTTALDRAGRTLADYAAVVDGETP